MPNFKVFNTKARNLKVLIHGEYSGVGIPAAADDNGYLYVKTISDNNTVVQFPKTAFGEVRTAELVPVAGWTFNYNINTDLVDTVTTGSGSITQEDSKAKLQTSTSISSSAKLETKQALRYVPGIGALLRFTCVFSQGVSGTSQIIGIGDDTDGFFYGYNGDTFGLLHRRNTSDTWISQSSWNRDKMDGTGESRVDLEPTKGNIYSIRYQWLGFGAIDFMISNPVTAENILVHRIEYANKYTIPSVYNPTLPVMAKVDNGSVETNIVLETPSAMAFQEGNVGRANTVMQSLATTVSGAGASEIPVLSIRNKMNFAGKTNRTRAIINYMTQATEGNKPVLFRMIKDSSLAGASWSDVATNTSIMEYDTSASGLSGGTNFYTVSLGKSDSQSIDMGNMRMQIAPGETITISSESTAGADNELVVSIIWTELF